MGFLLRCRYWSVLVAIVVCKQGKISTAERVQGCVWTQLSLRCPEMKVIQITAVVLGKSYCQGSWCCIKDSDCTHDANANHKTGVHRRCNNRHNCTIGVLQEKIPCGYWGVWNSNDFERITYNCINDHRSKYDTMNNSSYENSTEDDNYPDSESDIFTSTPETDSQTGAGSAAPEFNSQVLTVVIVIICLIILLVIVMLIVVIYRRKKKRREKSLNGVKMSDVETEGNETNYMNVAHKPSSTKNISSSISICRNDNSKEVGKALNCGAKNLETQTSDYCELEGVAIRRIQSDSEYEELKHGRNYEPLIVYEQLQSPLRCSPT